ncbi:MAG TPA: hypothetical protein VE988_26410 [Gemmataceae bacterium]|nr:hypothetical protein [Gemmataceae bacterium]
MLRKLAPIALFAVALFAVPSSANDDPGFRRFLSSVAQKEAQAQAKKTKLAINQGGFQGHLELPYPEKIQVDVTSFELKNDTVKSAVTVVGDFRITGIWTRDGQSVNINADVAAKLTVRGVAKFEKQGSDYFVAPTLTDCDFTILKLNIQAPAELADSNELLADIANTAFQNHKADIISQINRSMSKYQLKF